MAIVFIFQPKMILILSTRCSQTIMKLWDFAPFAHSHTGLKINRIKKTAIVNILYKLIEQCGMPFFFSWLKWLNLKSELSLWLLFTFVYIIILVNGTRRICIIWTYKKYRSSSSQMFFKISVLKVSQISQENSCVGVSF